MSAAEVDAILRIMHRVNAQRMSNGKRWRYPFDGSLSLDEQVLIAERKLTRDWRVA